MADTLQLLHMIMPTHEKLHLWCCSPDGTLIRTSCPDPAWWDFVKELGGLQKIRTADSSLPYLIGSSVGLHWSVAGDGGRENRQIYLLGPAAFHPLQEPQIRHALPSAPWVRHLLNALPEIPVIPYGIFIHYAVLLHNILHNDSLSIDHFLNAGKDGAALPPPVSSHDRQQVYLAEKEMLRMVREGNIHYAHAITHSSTLSPGVPVHGRDPLRQAKTSIIVFTTLVCRAAIEGGLSPEIAYPLGDSYIQAAEDLRNSADLSTLAQAMYHDFIYRVHQLHAGPGYSPAIQKCCDYIELRLEKAIRAAELASLTGYTEYYLTEKFKKETGMTVSRYVLEARIARACTLLKTTSMPVHEIASQLAFNTPNYFIQCFRSVQGVTPAQYRKGLSN